MNKRLEPNKKQRKHRHVELLCSTGGCDNARFGEWECCERCLQLYVDRDHDDAKTYHCLACGAHWNEKHSDACAEVARWKAEAEERERNRPLGPELPSWWHSAQSLLAFYRPVVEPWLSKCLACGAHGSELAENMGDYEHAEKVLMFLEATGRVKRGIRSPSASQLLLQQRNSGDRPAQFHWWRP